MSSNVSSNFIYFECRTRIRQEHFLLYFFLVTSKLEDYQTKFFNLFFYFSKALGAYLSRIYSDDVVVLLATLIAILDLLFILCCVPESRKQPQTVIEGINSNGFSANPFIILRFLRDEQTILRLSAITFCHIYQKLDNFHAFLLLETGWLKNIFFTILKKNFFKGLLV
uniref:Uncharacterized protein n=1 Tax=Meloidogyne incognita TaxID=6306 RepID=A0A914NIG2_MELIC